MLDHRTTVYICPKCHQTFRTANTVFGMCPNCNVNTVYDPVCRERDRYRAALERLASMGCPLKDYHQPGRQCNSMVCIAQRALEKGGASNA